MQPSPPVTSPLSPDELRKIHAYWRAANYLSVGQIYLYDNPLLTEPLTLEHIKILGGLLLLLFLVWLYPSTGRGISDQQAKGAAEVAANVIAGTKTSSLSLIPAAK